jgi:hypothetical protein
MLKKLVIVAVLAALMVLLPAFAPPAAYAQHGHHGGWLAPCILGGCLGWLLGQRTEVVPVYQPSPTPAVRECYKKVPGHWEDYWYPGEPYPRRVWIEFEKIPCP